MTLWLAADVVWIPDLSLVMEPKGTSAKNLQREVPGCRQTDHTRISHQVALVSISPLFDATRLTAASGMSRRCQLPEWTVVR